MKRFTFAVVLTFCSTAIWAQPVATSPDAQAKAKEAAAKVAWSSKVDAYKLCMSQNKVASLYRKNPPNKKPVPPPSISMACSDPGPYSSNLVAPKSLETAGAHSPAETAKSPPSTTAPQSKP